MVHALAGALGAFGALGVLAAVRVPPSGVYYARVDTVVTKPQEITVSATRPWRASISLRGLIHFDDEFTFEHTRGEWRAHFSPAMERLLRRYRCRMEAFEYDSGRDEARVTIRLPVLGRRRIDLHALRDRQARAIRVKAGG